MERAKYLLKSIQMRKCHYFGHVVRAAKLQKKLMEEKSRRNEEDGKTEEIMNHVRTDGDGPQEQARMQRPVHPSYGRVKQNVPVRLFVCRRFFFKFLCITVSSM